MTKRKEFRASAIAVDLFPFLSILCALIGTLVLILVSLTVSHVGKVAAAEEISGIQVVRFGLDYVDTVRMSRQQRADPDLDRTAARLRAERDSVRTQLRNLGAEPRQFAGQPGAIATSANVARSLLSTDEVSTLTIPPITVRPGGSGTLHRAVKWIDCTERALVIKGKDDDLRILRADITRSPELSEALREIKAHDNPAEGGWELIFLIRPDGIETFRLAEKVAHDAHVDYGYLPVPGHGPVDLSRFEVSNKK